MDEETKKIANEAVERADEVTRLLKQSIAIHQLENQGFIDEMNATDIAIELNKQAVVEAEKVIELQKDFIEKLSDRS